MKIKRIISLLLTIVMCLGVFAFSVDADSYGASDEKVLYALGVLDSASNDLAKPVTRIEMVKYAARLYGSESLSANGETPFADVAADNEASGAVNFAIAKNIISKGDMFYPDRNVKFEEAVKMIVAALGYNDLAGLMGGYPNGYLALASEIGLLKDIKAGAGNELTLKGVVQLLSRALSCTVCNPILALNRDTNSQVIIPDTYAKESVLNKRFKISKYGAFIASYDSSTGEVKAEIRSKDKDDLIAAYNVSDVVNLTVKDDSIIGDIEYTYANIYVNDADELIFAATDKNIEVIIGSIYEVNKSHNSASHYPSYINTIGFEDSEDYVDVADECRLYFNGQPASDNTAYPFVGAFARAVIYKDEIIALEAYELSEGGITTSIGDNDINYLRGTSSSVSLKDISGYKNLSIYINGLKSDFFLLTQDMLFDYYASSDKETLVIVASTRAIADEFTSATSSAFNIGGDFYPISEEYQVYYSLDGKLYKDSGNYYDLMRRTVKAYIDYAGYVRYIRPVLDDELSKEYYALILGYSQSGLNPAKIQAYVLIDGTIQEKTYPLTEAATTKYSVELANIREQIARIKAATETAKNNAYRDADITYKIKVDRAGQIVGLAKATLIEETTRAEGALGYTVNRFGNFSEPYMNSPALIMFGDAPILVFYYSQDKGLIMDVIDWTKLKNHDASLFISPYAEPGSSDIDLVLIRGEVESLVNDSKHVSGFASEISTVYSTEYEKEVLSVKIGGIEYTVSKDKDKLEGMERAYITYNASAPFMPAREIIILGTPIDLSGDPEGWEIVDGTTDGIHKDEVEKVDEKRVWFSSGDVWYMTETAPIYKIVETGDRVKFVSATRGELAQGTDVWYIYGDGQIKAIMFR